VTRLRSIRHPVHLDLDGVAAGRAATSALIIRSRTLQGAPMNPETRAEIRRPAVPAHRPESDPPMARANLRRARRIRIRQMRIGDDANAESAADDEAGPRMIRRTAGPPVHHPIEQSSESNLIASA
jgi:hypothetical protein